MSYAKAMKHTRNVRKCRKQGNMYFGFDTGSSWPNPRRNPYIAAILNIEHWFKYRNFDKSKVEQAKYRNSIRAEIKIARSLQPKERRKP